MTDDKKVIPSVSVSYARNGSSTKANALGMRLMQERYLPGVTSDELEALSEELVS